MNEFWFEKGHALKVQPSRALANTGGTEASTWTVGGACVERGTYKASSLLVLQLLPDGRPERMARIVAPRTDESNVIFRTALRVETLRVWQAAEG